MKELITKIGDIELEQNVNTISDIREFSNKEYREFERKGFTKAFRNDKFYFATSTIYFAGVSWDMGILATKDDLIYKIYVSNKDHSILNNVYSFLKDNMGNCNEQNSLMYIWDKPEGNLILQNDPAGIAIFITSSTISRS